MIDNKKYLKEISSMYASANKVKKYVLAELEKIDEKYRKLIEQEKKQLNEHLQMLNDQIKFYSGIINPETTETVEPETPQTAEEKAEEVEEKIQDTIFSENNEEESVSDLDAEEDADWEQKIESGELTAADSTNEVTQQEQDSKNEFDDIWPEKEEEKKEPVVISDDDNWGEIPQEW